MPRQVNIAIGTVASRAWSGTTSFANDIRRHLRFAWSFEVVGPLAVDAVFQIQSAPPSDADPCVPGAWSPVPEISICDFPAVPGPQATVIIPAGTPAGTICGGTIPCRPDAFVRLVGVGVTGANVRATMLRQGPLTP